MAAVTICSDFGAQENKVCCCFHCFPIYLPWSDRTGYHDHITKWSIPKSDWLYYLKPKMEKLIFCWYSQQKQDLKLIGSDHELLIEKFRFKSNKIGKSTRWFRYDLNQTRYHYIVEVTNRFKGLDLVDRVPEELWMEVYNIVQEAVTKTSPKKKKFKWQSGCLRRL